MDGKNVFLHQRIGVYQHIRAARCTTMELFRYCTRPIVLVTHFSSNTLAFFDSLDPAQSDHAFYFLK